MTVATPTSFDIPYYVNKHKAYWNNIVISYTFLAYVGGIVLSFMSGIWLNFLGVLFLTHSLIYSAYLSHEFMHGNIFKNRYNNVIFGQIMLWINGGCYYGFEALTIQHIAHHINRVDLFTFDIQTAIQKLPTFTRRLIFALEWCYFPIVSFWSRWQGILTVWRRQKRKKIILSIFIIRLAIFLVIAIFSIKALLLYFLAYLGMITVLRFVDAFQHTYEAFPSGSKLPQRDLEHEQLHTYSNLISVKYPWLNLLILNFCYHNAHHAVMKCPWHSIPALNLELNKDKSINYISLVEQLNNYHRYRITRLIAGQGNANGKIEYLDYQQFYGANDVSFITIY